MNKLSAIYQVVIGSGMIGIWILLFSTGRIPELKTEPIRITMHIAAEVITGILLLICGILTLKNGVAHKPLYHLSFGALLYTLIASPGYYGGKGEWGAFVVFMIMLALSIVFIVAAPKSDA